jgi:CheY-like chemotaxis protein
MMESPIPDDGIALHDWAMQRIRTCGGGNLRRVLMASTSGSPFVSARGIMEASGKPLAGTILVVDDNRDAVDAIAILLETCGYTVARAGSAYEAVDVLDGSREIRLVLCDVRMPGVDGFDFLRVVRHRFPSLPIVLITGLPITSEDVVPRDATILRKPFAMDELERVVAEALQGSGATGAGPGVA